MRIRNQAIHARAHGRLAVQSLRRHKKPVIAVWGNCQAPAIAKILSSVPQVAENFDVLRLPAVQEIARGQLALARTLIRRADVVITQPVRSDYRGLPIGTEQILDHAPTAQVITYPSMFYTGLHPFIVYVHASGELGTQAPLTSGYHDLRFIARANRVVAGLPQMTEGPWAHAIIDNARQSFEALQARERSLDVTITPSISGADSFWTINHPSNRVLSYAAGQMLEALGINAPVPNPTRELLSDQVLPVSVEVRHALGLPPPTRSEQEWRTGGGRVSDEVVAEAHISFYQRRADILDTAVSEHHAALVRYGFLI